MKILRRWPTAFTRRQYYCLQAALGILTLGWVALFVWAWSSWDSIGWIVRVAIGALLALSTPSPEDLFQTHDEYLRQRERTARD